MTFEDAIAYSRNVVAAKVALGLGDNTRESSAILHEAWTRLGFGQPTGIDVAGEVRGLVNDPTITPWGQIDLANGSFGQGIAVTPIQLATAFSAMVNGGTLVQPHVVTAIGDREIAPAPRGQVIDADAVDDAHRDDEPRRHRGPVLPRPNARPRLRRRRQDGHRPDLGPDRAGGPGRLEAQPLQLQLRRIHRPRCRRPGSRHLSEDQRGHARRSPGSASWRCRSCRSSCSAASRPTRSRVRGCCRSGGPRPHR